MPTSPRMAWPYPSEGADPWYEAFVRLIQAIDSSVYPSREDRNIIIMGGGTISFDGGTGLLTWSDNIDILSAVTGFLWRIAPSSIAVADGQLLYTSLVRGPTSTVTLTLATTTNLPATVNGDNFFVLAVRNGDGLYFRDGRVLLSGQSFEFLMAGQTTGPTQEVYTSFILADGAQVFSENVGIAKSVFSLETLYAVLDKAISAGTLTIRVKSGAAGGGSTIRHSMTMTGADPQAKKDDAGIGPIAELEYLELEIETDVGFLISGGAPLQLDVMAILE